MSQQTMPLSDEYAGNIPGWRRLSHPTRAKVVAGFQNFLTATGLFVILFPMFWMVSTALRPTKYTLTRPTPLLPPEIAFTQFQLIIFDSKFPTFYYNSIVTTLGVVILTTTIATLGGYGLTRIRFPYKRGFARIILFGYMFPAILLAIPMFIFWRQLGIINSFPGLILAMTARALPFALWLMWKFFQTVPYSLEESAQMAGASKFRAFYEIALPMAKPGVIAIAIFSYALSWNEYTIPKILMPEANKWVLTVGLDSFVQQDFVAWGQIMSASILMMVPSFLFIFFLQKYLLRGFRAGGVG